MSHARIGMNSRNACGNAQSLADMAPRCGLDLARASRNGMVQKVMEARSPAALTICHFRYPSPVGRLCADSCTPPTFSIFTESYESERQFAGYLACRLDRFDAARGLRFCGADQNALIEGAGRLCKRLESCKENNPRLFSLFPRFPFSGLRPVVTRCRNRPFWAAGRVPSRGLWSAAASSQAPLWAQLAMSSIAKPIRAVADDLTAVTRTARTYSISAIAALGSGGLFYAKSQTGPTTDFVARPRLSRRDR